MGLGPAARRGRGRAAARGGGGAHGRGRRRFPRSDGRRRAALREEPRAGPGLRAPGPAEHRRRGGDRARHALGRRPLPRARPLRAHGGAGARPHGRDRRPPHDLRRAVPPHRRHRDRRPDHPGDAVRNVPLPRLQARDRGQRRLARHPRPRLRHVDALGLPPALRRVRALDRLRAPGRGHAARGRGLHARRSVPRAGDTGRRRRGRSRPPRPGSRRGRRRGPP